MTLSGRELPRPECIPFIYFQLKMSLKKGLHVPPGRCIKYMSSTVWKKLLPSNLSSSARSFPHPVLQHVSVPKLRPFLVEWVLKTFPQTFTELLRCSRHCTRHPIRNCPCSELQSNTGHTHPRMQGQNQVCTARHTAVECLSITSITNDSLSVLCMKHQTSHFSMSYIVCRYGVYQN